jgi:effector-binding domain-containing protein
MSSEGFKIAKKQVGDMLIASIRFRERHGGIEKYVEKLYRHCVEYVCGPPFTLYHNPGPEKDYDAESCVPVIQVVETDEIKSRMLTGGTVLYIVHRGSLDTLGAAWEVLFDYIERHNIVVGGPVREIYPEGYEKHSNNCTEYLTELQVPLR